MCCVEFSLDIVCTDKTAELLMLLYSVRFNVRHSDIVAFTMLRHLKRHARSSASYSMLKFAHIVAEVALYAEAVDPASCGSLV